MTDQVLAMMLTMVNQSLMCMSSYIVTIKWTRYSPMYIFASDYALHCHADVCLEPYPYMTTSLSLDKFDFGQDIIGFLDILYWYDNFEEQELC